MGWFGSSTEKPAIERYPVNIDVTSQRGSGAEQDRYGQHFSQTAEAVERGVNRGIEQVKKAVHAKGEGAEQDRYNAHLSIGDEGYKTLKKAAQYQGDGAEQDRYAARFSPYLHNYDAQTVRRVAAAIAAKGPQAGFSGLGYDGQQRARLLAGSGVGAEQVR